ncbi:MAG: hypothetical protein IKX86_03485 [Clostridia bacterium]|nr:hypothetical protein [Clostridia bacterium]
MKQGAELTTAIVDLLTGLALIPFIIILLRKRRGPLAEGWTRLLIALSAAHIGGFVAHAFLWTQPAYDIYWIFLYAAMFYLLACVADLAFFKAGGAEAGKTAKTVLFFIICAAFAVTAVMNFFIEKDILIFLAAAALVGLPSLAVIGWAGAKAHDRGGVLVLVSLIPLLIGLPFMFLQTGEVMRPFGVPFDHNGVCHLCLLVTLVIVGFAALSDAAAEEKAVALCAEK